MHHLNTIRIKILIAAHFRLCIPGSKASLKNLLSKISGVVSNGVILRQSQCTNRIR